MKDSSGLETNVQFDEINQRRKAEAHVNAIY